MFICTPDTQRSFPFHAFPLELQRGISIRTVLVRARAFVDGLKERSAEEGIQIFVATASLHRWVQEPSDACRFKGWGRPSG